MVIVNIVMCLVSTCFLRCVFTHPGTIPEDPAWLYKLGTQEEHGTQFLQAPSSELERKRDDSRRRCKWCTKFKPDRCHHCRVCQQCILKMDHHCHWIFNCVGFRNHKYFFLLIFYACIGTHFIFWSLLPSVWVAAESELPFLDLFGLFFTFSLSGLIATVNTGFLAFHTRLMLRATTTIEYCEVQKRHSYYSYFEGSPYDRGVYVNICAILGENVLLWFLPCSPATGDGVTYTGEANRLLAERDVEQEQFYSTFLPATLTSHGDSRQQLRGTEGAAGTGEAPESIDSPMT